MSWYEIPLDANPQNFSITLAGKNYDVNLTYRDASEGGWFIDLSDASGNPLVNGIPLVTGVDLLEQYRHLKIGGHLYVFTDGDPLAEPSVNNLGTTSHLYFST